MKVYIARHGQDDDSVRGGWNHLHLTPLGIEQSQNFAEKLFEDKDIYKIGKIYSSDLKRAVQTAEIISDKLGIEVDFSPDFREVNNGALAGMKNEIADLKYPNLYWRNLEWNEKYPSGESPREFFERVSFAWKELLDKNSSYDKNILLITHGGVINIIKCLVKGENYSNKNKYQGLPCADICFEYEI